MTTGIEYTRTDSPAGMPRWLILTLATIATVLAIGMLWSLAPGAGCAGDGILPGPQPCGSGGAGPALVTAGILLALLAAVYVVAFTVERRRRMVLLILGGAMLLVLLIGVMATLAAAAGPIIYY
ncbi:MAG: hypothetical protein KF727_04470 [Microbacteriaceae bacterium]|nr:hypothetical protein [Microbacteriaceae bacterium]